MNMHVERKIVRKMIQIANDYGYTPVKVCPVNDLHNLYPKDDTDRILNKIFDRNPSYFILFANDDPRMQDIKIYIAPGAGFKVVSDYFEIYSEEAGLIYVQTQNWITMLFGNDVKEN